MRQHLEPWNQRDWTPNGLWDWLAAVANTISEWRDEARW